MGSLEANRIDGIGRRLWRRQRGDKIRRLLQIRIAPAFCQLGHRLDRAQLFTKHKELDQRVFRWLCPERRHILGFRLARRPVAGKAGLELLRRRCRKGGERAGKERCGNDAAASGTLHRYPG